MLPNRTYYEVARVASELKRIGPELVDLKQDNKVGILFSADSANAISYMPFSDRVDYSGVMRQMYDALYDLNVEPDYVQAGDSDLSRYKVLLVPPLYSASDKVLDTISQYVKNGGQVVMAFKSGFTDEHSTVRDVLAPGPLRSVCGFHYQEFSNLAEPESLTPDAYHLGDENKGSIWQEFLIPDTAKVVESFQDKYWHFPAITQNDYGKGSLTYEAAYVTNRLQREIIREVLKRAGLTGPDQDLPPAVKVRHGRNRQGKLLHYYFNFSGDEEPFVYPYENGVDLLTNKPVNKGQTVRLAPWDLIIVSE